MNQLAVAPVRRGPALALIALIPLAFAALLGVVGAAQAQPACSFTLGFKVLRDMIPGVVGGCLENEQYNSDNGNAEQRTSGGLLVWRKADNWTAFTDGTTTWINGPVGLASRPNGGPLFAWEGSAGGDSGIEGQALAGPACPVQRLDRPCPDRPYQADVTVLDGQGAVVTRFQTDSEGRFRVPLPPGTYRLRPESPGFLPRGIEQTATVKAGQFTTVTIQYDTGIR